MERNHLESEQETTRPFKDTKKIEQKRRWFYRHLYTILAVCGIFIITAAIGVGIYFFRPDQNNPKAEIPVAAEVSFHQFTDQVFQEWVKSDAINLHYILANPENYGITGPEAVWSPVTEESFIEYYQQLDEIKTQLEGFSYEQLTREEQITYDVFHTYLETELKGKDLYLYQEILSPLTGVQSQTPIFLSEYSFYRTKDVEDYLKLCEEIPEYFEQILQFEKEKSKAGLFMSDSVLDEIVAQCKEFIADTNNHMLVSTFVEKINAMQMDEAVKQDYIARNQQIVTEKVIPAYRQLVDGLNTLRGTGINGGGVCNFKDGKEYYEYMVASNTGSSKTVDELKKKIMQAVYDDLSAVAQLLQKNPQISQEVSAIAYPSADPYEILNQLQEHIKKDFPELPQTSYEVKYINPSLQNYLSPAFYLSPPIDKTDDNVIYINQSPEHDLTKIYPTIAHEGYPGHLYQIVYFRQNNQNNLRKILNFQGYTEGWAVYCEYMSYHMMDTLSEPMQSYMEHISSAALGIHALMDIGIHYEGWNMEKIRTYVQNYFGDVGEDTIREIYYNIIEEPGNYLSYYVGYLEILDLKKQAENAWKDEFTLKKFHQKLMDIGPAPFEVLSKYLLSN